MSRQDREMEIGRHIGRRIKERRTMVGISQGDLGMMLGVTFQQIQKYESGANRVSARKLVLIAEALDVPIAWFYEGVQSTAPAKAREPFDSRDMRLALRINGLSDERRTAVARIVELFAEDR